MTVSGYLCPQQWDVACDVWLSTTWIFLVWSCIYILVDVCSCHRTFTSFACSCTSLVWPATHVCVTTYMCDIQACALCILKIGQRMLSLACVGPSDPDTYCSVPRICESWRLICQEIGSLHVTTWVILSGRVPTKTGISGELLTDFYFLSSGSWRLLAWIRVQRRHRCPQWGPQLSSE